MGWGCLPCHLKILLRSRDKPETWNHRVRGRLLSKDVGGWQEGVETLCTHHSTDTGTLWAGSDKAFLAQIIHILVSVDAWYSNSPLQTLKKVHFGVPIVAQWKRTRLVLMSLWVRSLASLSGSRIWCCRELHCRSQMWLGSRVAVAVTKGGSCSSDLTPSCTYGPKNLKKEKKRLQKKLIF